MKNKLLCLTIGTIVWTLYGPAALALDTMGPPASGLAKGQFHAGVDYSDTRMDMKLGDGLITDRLYQHGALASTTVTSVQSETLRHLKMHKTYANLGYGFTDNWEAFIRLGGMNTEFTANLFPNTSRNGYYNGDTGFAIGFGTKATFYEQDKLKLGGLFQMSWASSEARRSGASGMAEDVELKIAEMQIAIGPTYKLTKNVSIHGGPFWHFIHFPDSEIHSDRTIITDPSQDESRISRAIYNIEDVSRFGAYIGTQVEVLKNTFYCIEWQHTSSADALAMNLLWRR